jgi:putative FmdB family regulatory protein
MSPYYEYLCDTCKRITLKFVRITQSDKFKEVPCRHGCKTKAKRIISKTSFHLKGGRWASTNYE